MDIVLLIIVILSNIACFFIGAKIGQSVTQGKDITIPNPIRKISERTEEKKREKEREALEIMMNNIDVYDGTAIGQKDIN